MTETHAESVTAGSWRELLGPKNLGASTVLAGGVALYATNEFLTISLLPSAVAEIGGHRFYAWVTTVYLVASAPRRLSVRCSAGLGPAGRICPGWLCSAPQLVVRHRADHGTAAGGPHRAGRGRWPAGRPGLRRHHAALPQSLWVRASALVSAMWGVGTLLGPAGGGLFAQFGSWRWAFGVLVILTAAMAVLVPWRWSRPGGQAGRGGCTPIPVWSLLLLGTAALAISVAGIPRDPALTSVLLVAGLGLVAAFLVVDRRLARAGTARASVLPPTAFRPGPLKWIYLTLGLLMAATMVDMYVPLFGQRLAHLEPLVAGFLGVTLAVGWTTGRSPARPWSADRR